MLSVKTKFHILFHARNRCARRNAVSPGLDPGIAYAEAVSSAFLRRFGTFLKEVPTV